MDVVTDTPLGTPTKCGCASGIVVSCGSASVARGRPSPTAKRRFQIAPPPECPICAEEARNNQYYPASGVAMNDAAQKGKVMIDDRPSDARGPNAGRERRSYASLLRGALGRWSGKRKRTSRCRENDSSQELTNAYSQVPNSCTNNNCESLGRWKSNHANQAMSELAHPVTAKGEITDGNSRVPSALDPKHPSRRETETHRGKGLESRNVNGLNSGQQLRHETGRKKESNRVPAAPSFAKQRSHRVSDGSACHKNLLNPDGNPRPGSKKLPSLPYRDEPRASKPSVTGALENNKRRRGKRKYFSSPIHRKQPNRDGKDIQSTYVSFQDDFAKDVYLNVEKSPPTSTTPDSAPRGSSWSRLTSRRRRNDSDISPPQVSPTTPTDDVFAESSPETRLSERDLDDDALIEKLFHKVNAAFGPGPERSYSEGSNHPQDTYTNRTRYHSHNYDENLHRNRTDMRQEYIKCAAPSYGNTAMSNFHHEPIEAIMTSANLHASLENAMSMLNESTKLLSPVDKSGPQHPEYLSRHLLGGGTFLPSHQHIRPRTYSTCSRLETIAEENDRIEDSTPDTDRKNAEDVTSCTFSDTSEYEKPLLHQASRADSDSVFSGITKHSLESDLSSMFLQRHHAESVYEGRDWKQTADEYDQKTRLLLRACPNGAVRRESTSTISVSSLRKDNSKASPSAVHGQVFGPTTAEKCAACEWARRSQFNFPSVPVIPGTAWPRIVRPDHDCQDQSHIHPWGMCTERHGPPVLCHSHYLQYYQYLQSNPKLGRSRRQQLRSASSQGDSLIDYDINEVISSLDELVMSNPPSANSSTANIYRSHHLHPIDRPLSHDDQRIVRSDSSFSPHYLDVRHYNKQQTHKQSDTDVSVNSDSAFSTNGSLTPSTRDGVNTDRDSVDSMTDDHNMDPHRAVELNKIGTSLSNSQYPGSLQTLEGFHGNSRALNAECVTRLTATHVSCTESQHSRVSSRGQRTQSYEESKPQKCLLTATDLSHCHNKRYSVVSSVGSSSPLASDQLCDSAVHLQDNSSSRSTQLSSDSFYSTGTSHGDKDTCLLDGALSLNSISRSSSEASLNSEGTLCLSDYAMSQQNISLCCAQSFPQISEICSPVHSASNHRSAIPEENPFRDWINQAEVTENGFHLFINENDNLPVKTMRPGGSAQDSAMGNKGFFDTLASSSGSSDSNTLGSGSSGSTYASSSLRSHMSSSRFNTFDSSSCVSTDDTGETVIDQHMIRANGRLHDIDEQPSPRVKVRRKRSGNDDKKRYRASAFHYENLDMPQFINDCEDAHLKTQNHDQLSKGEVFELAVTKDFARNVCIEISRERSSSLSCITTSVTKVSCIVRQCKSLSNVQECDLSASFEKVEISESNTVIQIESEETPSAITPEESWSPKCSVILQTKVDSMIQNCNHFDNIIASLRESLRYHTTSEERLDKKLLELGEILKQKDEVINQLHRMLLTSYSFSHNPLKYSANATI